MSFARRISAITTALLCCGVAVGPSAAQADQAPGGERADRHQSRLLFTQSAPRATFVPARTAKGHVRKGRYVLTLRGVSRQMVWFEDHPDRGAGDIPVRSFIRSWADFGFAKDPPNAALTVLHGRRDQDTIIVALGKPRYYRKSRSVQYRARLLSSADGGLAHFEHRRDRSIPRKVKDVSLFIDDAAGQVVDGCQVGAGVSCPENDGTDAKPNAVQPSTFRWGTFAWGTPVMTPNGGRKVIQQVRRGEQVMSIDTDGTPTPATVTAASGTALMTSIAVYVEFGDQQQMISMSSTLFAGGVSADGLAPGDTLRTAYGTDERVARVLFAPYTGRFYGLVVDGPTGMFFADGVLVATRAPMAG
jgi:hypothetical protein